MKQMPPGHLLKETTCCVFLNIIPLSGQIYILRESENQYALFQHEVITPPQIDIFRLQKNTIYIRQVL